MQAASGIKKSKELKAQSEYNAAIYQQQANMVEEQKGIEAYQYDRAINRARSTAIARTGKAGLLLSGSPLAVMIDTETQMQLDKSIGQYNLEVRKRYALSGSRETLRRGRSGSRMALQAGYTNAFTTLLSTAATAYGGGLASGKTATTAIHGKINVAPSNYYLRAGRI